MDACGNPITPVAGTPSPTACEGPMVYTFTYTDCAGKSCMDIHLHHRHSGLHVAGDEASTVNCPADAVAPTPPTMSMLVAIPSRLWRSHHHQRLAKVPWSTPSPTRIAQVIQSCMDIHLHHRYTGLHFAGRWIFYCELSLLMLLHQHHLLCGCLWQYHHAGGSAPSPTACEGAMVYTFTYTDCAR